MFETWVGTNLETVGLIVLSAAGIYVTVMVYTRLAGLRSFTKMSAFDFVATVATGTVVASTIIAGKPSLAEGAVALAALFSLQATVSLLRRRSGFLSRLVDNQPALLMLRGEVVRENLRRARITENDLREKLREAGVGSIEGVLAVVMETTGDISVIQGGAGDRLDPDLFEDVVGAERLRGGPGST